MINNEIDLDKLPKNIALIMDGNRTWAKNKGLDPKEGHRMLLVSLDKIIKYAYKLGISQVTFYAFSTENWKRSKDEVDFLMEIYNNFIKNFNKEYEDVEFRLAGSMNKLPEFLKQTIIDTTNKTNKNSKMIFNMALNYGSRDEIVNATKNILADIKNGKINIDEIDENKFEKYLYTKDCSPDLLIRTSGQIRLSNFLLWQLAYAEMYFTNVYWPDFDEKEFDKALIEYQRRNRKFGGN